MSLTMTPVSFARETDGLVRLTAHPELNEALKPARGLVNGLILAAAFWAMVLVAVVLLA